MPKDREVVRQAVSDVAGILATWTLDEIEELAEAMCDDEESTQIACSMLYAAAESKR